MKMPRSHDGKVEGSRTSHKTLFSFLAAVVICGVTSTGVILIGQQQSISAQALDMIRELDRASSAFQSKGKCETGNRKHDVVCETIAC